MGVNSIMVYGCQVLLYESQKYKGLKGFVFSLLPNLGNKRVFLGQGNACDTNIQKEGCDNIECDFQLPWNRVRVSFKHMWQLMSTQLKQLYRLVQLNFTQEIEVLSIFPMTSVKKHIEYFHFGSKIQLDQPPCTFSTRGPPLPWLICALAGNREISLCGLIPPYYPLQIGIRRGTKWATFLLLPSRSFKGLDGISG